MSRVKRGTVTHKRHKRLLKKTEGFWGQRKNVFRRAKETLLRAMAFAFKGRKLKKRSMRNLFIVRVHAAAQANGLSYNKFMSGLKKANIQLDRKMLSQLAIFEPQAFTQLVEIAKI
ncbi:TPA: 50S ribosomal protein L20 [Candidatus Dependentiae bacterium]|nr:MAG: 50S ribosomal protein L20 [candidate division TM6 bacterium GW2011_GWF2_36_131]KKQ03187.1 MAG: 50S ribosomal protein L20 [candidate division TM6 bacterium GW2011_GWE2_36_25]KKQ18545.1 MAG: 50S ribosomal protein L20 [candidate division TM6 bacterium GW2011_GWA2_36_9]HBR70383.1 50S ribosomal protein L20 [Candidatus Dependentiae bacterium]HCU00928.1 50S ribosomal protein L20 [Candidatus Dependentiae bacterium]